MTGLAYVATLTAALGCGLVAGAFFAFSGFVMPALRRLPPAQGVAAMQSINVLAVTPPLMIAMFGTAAACLGLSGWAVISAEDGLLGAVLAGAALYLVGAIWVTVSFNVPLNNRLARANAESPEAAEVWSEYLTKWTLWNTVRTAAALAASGAFAIALGL